MGRLVTHQVGLCRQIQCPVHLVLRPDSEAAAIPHIDWSVITVPDQGFADVIGVGVGIAHLVDVKIRFRSRSRASWITKSSRLSVSFWILSTAPRMPPYSTIISAISVPSSIGVAPDRFQANALQVMRLFQASRSFAKTAEILCCGAVESICVRMAAVPWRKRSAGKIPSGIAHHPRSNSPHGPRRWKTRPRRVPSGFCLRGQMWPLSI